MTATSVIVGIVAVAVIAAAAYFIFGRGKQPVEEVESRIEEREAKARTEEREKLEGIEERKNELTEAGDPDNPDKLKDLADLVNRGKD